MSGVAPEPAPAFWREVTDTASVPLAIVRGHTSEGHAGQLAHDLADLLNRAAECAVAIIPVTDPGDGRHDALYSVEGAAGSHRSNWVIEYDTATGRWNATAD